ncbi:hypothetical protein LCGC14_3028280 [marine sediment metagenome]|uniref:Uncharacterized protein n=1 Tax=marine sediment metagenome TaxID=412755 RepID=A0A0F8ZJA8_9ZZZZ
MVVMAIKVKCMVCGQDDERPDDKPLSPGVGHICMKCVEPDWEGECENCGATPVVPLTGLCGPCTFGEASTANGNW